LPRGTRAERHHHQSQRQRGGAANVAVNAATLGARVDFLTVLGGDAEGRCLIDVVRAQGVDASGIVVDASRRTRAKHRITAPQQLLLSFDFGDVADACVQAQAELLERLDGSYDEADAVIVSDYGYGALTSAVIARLAALRARDPRVLVVDSRHRLYFFSSLRPTAVKPNFEEVCELLSGVALERFENRAQAVAAHGDVLLRDTAAQLVAATLDRDGAVLLEPERSARRVFGRPVQLRNAAGAGDTFAATLALALAAGAPSEVAGELATAAAACTAGELRDGFSPARKYIQDLTELVARIDSYREQGRRIVFTNGCFDILHRGHVTLLNQAKALGDVLVVAVNSDASIRRLKGPARPINSFDDRVQVLGALACVDHIIGFETDTCCQLVEAVRPHIFVKGGDYTRETLLEATTVERVGGVVHVLPYMSNRSTTGLIERIKQPNAQVLA